MIICINCKTPYKTVEEYIMSSRFDDKLGYWVHKCMGAPLPEIVPKTEGDITKKTLSEGEKIMRLLLGIEDEDL